MSCYEEARGEIKLPAAEAASIRRDMAKEARRIQESRDELALRVYRTIRERKLKARNGREIEDAISEVCRGLSCSQADEDQLLPRLCTYDPAKAPRGKLTRPKKSKPAPLTGNLTLAGEDWNIRIRGRILHLAIFENNHSIEYARKDPLFRACLRRLDRVAWTRGSGGTILQQDEYSKDAFRGPSTMLSYAPKTKSPAARHFRR